MPFPFNGGLFFNRNNGVFRLHSSSFHILLGQVTTQMHMFKVAVVAASIDTQPYNTYYKENRCISVFRSAYLIKLK